jgi:hypothetical protein
MSETLTSLDDLSGLLIYSTTLRILVASFSPDTWLTNDLCRQTLSQIKLLRMQILGIGLARCVAHTFIAPLPLLSLWLLVMAQVLSFKSPFILARVFFCMAFLVVVKRPLEILNVLYHNLIFSLLDFYRINVYVLCSYLVYAERLSKARQIRPKPCQLVVHICTHGVELFKECPDWVTQHRAAIRAVETWI